MSERISAERLLCLRTIPGHPALTRPGEVRELARELIDARARIAELEARAPVVTDDWRHIANEWTDAATNGMQWLRNVCDGISTVQEAVEAMSANIDRVRATPTPAALAVAGTGNGWRSPDILPDVGRKFVMLYNDGSGAVILFRHDCGYLDHEGNEFTQLEHIGLWSYLPNDFEFWCEIRPDEPMKLSFPVKGSGL